MIFAPLGSYSWNPIFAQDTPTQVHSSIVSDPDPFTFTQGFCKRIRIGLRFLLRSDPKVGTHSLPRIHLPRYTLLQCRIRIRLRLLTVFFKDQDPLTVLLRSDPIVGTQSLPRIHLPRYTLLQCRIRIRLRLLRVFIKGSGSAYGFCSARILQLEPNLCPGYTYPRTLSFSVGSVYVYLGFL